MANGEIAMFNEDVRGQYTATIGIECHVQLKTATKLFSSVANDAREAPPNTLVSHIDFGLPGALPVLNEEAIYLACKAAFALGSTPQKFSRFDRKHYFYPDLPKGYQISQFHQPIVLGGSINVDADGQPKTIGITRAHLEEDAGKSTHPAAKDYSLVDLNRAGTPLLEIVSEPDMHSAAEAKAYARELYLRMKFAGVSDCNLYYGNMRFDVNVSVSKTDEFGTRTETKNINSFRAVEKAVDYEISRQIEVLENGEKIVQETRGWDDTKLQTFSQRSKEDIEEYRYFPDPDLPPTLLSDGFVAKIKEAMPDMPHVWRERLRSLQLDPSHIETMLEAEVEDDDVSYLLLIHQSLTDEAFAAQLANWLVNQEIPMRRGGKSPKSSLTNEDRMYMYKQIYDLVKADKLSSTNAKALMADILANGGNIENIETYAEDKGFVQVSDESAIAEIVAKVLQENPKAAEDVKNGEMKAIGFLTGQVMKQSLGKANPQLAQKLIKNQLGI
jgi:aspartyl-tRNA(Asn)/glutamyl-tRNA(Gln) amidotransferase subunit B